MSSRLPLHVVLVAYGSVELLATALAGLDEALPVHIVDNGQSPQAEAVAQAGGHDYVRPDQNLGFGAAVNLALARIPDGADVLLLNPDARIRGADVRLLQDALQEQPCTAAVAPLLRRPDGSREATRWPLPTPLLPWRGVVGRGELRDDEDFFLSGAVLMLAGDALRDIGGFDERFFLYAEESDWQRRARSAGYALREIPYVEVEHLGAATSSDTRLRDIHFHGSAELYVRKWYGTAGWYVFRMGSLLAAIRRVVSARSVDARRQALRAVGLYVRGPASRLPVRTTP